MTKNRAQFYGPNGELFHPTLKFPEDHNAEEDAEVLHKAMKGWGTDENRIIEILGHRDVYQRIQIRDQYKASFGQDLIQRISGETSGHFRSLLKMLLTETAEVNARALYKAIKGGGTDEDTIIQVLCTSTNNEIMEIKEAYQSVLISYGINDPTRTLESDVEGDLSGCFKNLVIALLQAQREEADFEDVQKIPTRGLSSVVNMSQVEKDVDTIWNAGEGQLGTDESTFIKIVANRSVWHIQAIAKKFEEKYEKSLIDSLESETSGDFERALVLTVRSCLNRPKTYSDLLYKAMKGLGTDDGTLMRIIVTRCEIDLKSICKEFECETNSTVEEWIRDETSGDYRSLLLVLIGVE